MKFEVIEKHFVTIDNEYCGENDGTRCEYKDGTHVNYCKKFGCSLETHFVSNRDTGRQLRCNKCMELFNNSNEDFYANRWEVFQNSYDQSIESIKHYLENTETNEWELECKHLIKWLFETEHNPYGIFHQHSQCGGWLGHAEGFEGICSTIHHAICDDGDICYPVINDAPSIVFGWKHDEKLIEILLKEDEHRVRIFKEIGIYKPPTLTFLKNAYEFTKAYDKYEEYQAKRCEEFENRRWERGERVDE